jgi:hypothetical protein
VIRHIPQRVITPVVWYQSPEWLTVEQACYLTGHSLDDMMFIAEEGGVELDESGLINKDSLYEFQESLVELAHWDELVPAE